MATIPAGTVIWLSFARYEGELSTRTARYTAIDLTSIGAPIVLSDCTTAIQSNSESENPRIYALNSGNYAVSVGKRPINLFTSTSVPLVVKQGYSSPPEGPYGYIAPPANDGKVVYTVHGPSASTYYWVTFEWFADTPVNPSSYIGAGKMDQTTGTSYGLVSVAQVPSLTQTIYPVCIANAGILYYVVSSGTDQTTSTNDLYARDITTQLGPVPVLVKSYAPGDPYPIGGYALADGSLAVEFGSLLTSTVLRIDATDGHVLDNPGVDATDPVAGKDDTEWYSTDIGTGDIVGRLWDGTEIARISQATLTSLGLYERRAYYVVRPAFAGFDLTCADPTYSVQAPKWALYRFDVKPRSEQKA